MQTRLIAIGGGGMTDDIEDALFTSVEGKNDPHIVVMTIATSQPGDMPRKYNALFRKRGVRHVSIVNVEKREDSFDEASINKVGKADLIYFTGGDQLNITSLFGGSPLHNALQKRVETGITVAGTSAGAAMMSVSMMNGGGGDKGPAKNGVEIAPGLGLIDDVIIDTHFSQRGRHGRLLTAIAHYPQNLAVGLDERTAIIVDGTDLRVMGEGTVTIMDGARMTHADLVYTDDDNPIAMFDVRLHVLVKGYQFSLSDRKPTAPAFSRVVAGT